MNKVMEQWCEDTAKKPKTIVRPTGDKLLVRPIPDAPVTAGGIAIPETAQDPLFAVQRAMVVAMSGEARKWFISYNDDFKCHMADVETGSVVLVSKFGGTVITVDGEELKLFRAIEILAVLE